MNNPIPTLNNPDTIERARKKIAQLQDAREHFDLNLSYSVASGWIAALQVEGLITNSIFYDLRRELNQTHQVVTDKLPQPQPL